MTSNRPPASPTPEDRGDATPAVLFRLHARAVLAVCLAHTRNHHDAEDVAQAVFLKAVHKASGVRDPAKARGWLLQVARRACIDFYRRRRPVTQSLDDKPAPVAISADDSLAERLHAAVAKLPPSYREPIVLYYLDGHDCAGVADTLGTTENAVRQRLVRARAMLHDLLEEDPS